MADRVRFELTKPVKVLRISSAVPSTTRPPVRGALKYWGWRQIASAGHKSPRPAQWRDGDTAESPENRRGGGGPGAVARLGCAGRRCAILRPASTAACGRDVRRSHGFAGAAARLRSGGAE